jgi:hypothetical protein
MSAELHVGDKDPVVIQMNNGPTNESKPVEPPSPIRTSRPIYSQPDSIQSAARQPIASHFSKKRGIVEYLKDKGKELWRALPGLIKEFLKTAFIINAAFYLPRIFFSKAAPFISKFADHIRR